MSEGEEFNICFGAVIKGAVVGGIAVLIGSWLAAMPFMEGTPKSQAEAEVMTKALIAIPSYLFADLVVSLLCMGIGGYVTAGSAESSGVFNAALTGVVLLVAIGAGAMISSQTMPGWYNAAVFILIVPAAALGGKIRGS